MKAIAALSTVSLLLLACGSGGSPDSVCKHLAKFEEGNGEKAAQADAIKRCVEEMKGIKKEFGDEVWGKVSACALKAKKMEDLKDCDPEKFGKSSGKGPSSEGKQSEAVQFVKKLHDGARAYYMDQSSAAGSLTPVPRQFPGPSVGPTPPLGECCKSDGKCAPKAAAWSDSTWVALSFSVDDPHYYSYEYKVSDDKNSFTVSAYGDLDCDGEYSTFSMTGAATEDGPSGTSELKKTKPAE